MQVRQELQKKNCRIPADNIYTGFVSIYHPQKNWVKVRKGNHESTFSEQNRITTTELPRKI